MKIVYCLNAISTIGGVERAIITKANALSSIPENHVYIVVVRNDSQRTQGILSQNVNLINLDIDYYGKDKMGSLLRSLLEYVQKIKVHYESLKKVLIELNPDIVVAVGGFEKFPLAFIKKHKWKLIREVHSEKHYRRILADSFFKRLIAAISEFVEYKLLISRYDKIIVLTNEDRNNNWSPSRKFEVIPNPVSFTCGQPSSLNENTIVTVSRLDKLKNIGALINSFKIISEKHPDWSLKIYGDGPMRISIQTQINNLNLSGNVFMMGQTDNVLQAMCQASVFAFSSLLEGFPLVLVEAMECGVPVVSYQCPCGPKDIITDGVDGFLVPVNDEQMLADRICRLIEDEELRHKMGAAAKETVKKYHIENITKQWMQLFNELIHS